MKKDLRNVSNIGSMVLDGVLAVRGKEEGEVKDPTLVT